MSIWWVTKAISIYATAFIPLALFPIFGILSTSEMAENYGHNFVSLLLVGLIIAKKLLKNIIFISVSL
ncbi:anion permease [Bacteroidetes bacterium endosymbiont of Geopemphigus sp.]|uniref:anion permease n=1 Tax=Bacteroidetes bacterium endosymbiont of Geopemphigus sp. TaxID=2047937 RepID=UPI000CD075D3